jgi:hypothetical protein
MMGAHQKIDRVARRHLAELLPAHTSFPKVRQILQFEGKNGPDGIKRKSPSHDEPWHFLNPLDDTNHEFMGIINKHYDQLVVNLRRKNQERAAFEAAWLAHAIVDGLTPAHHFPYEEKVAELRTEGGNESRSSISKKLIFKGDNLSKTVYNTFKVYGPKGLLTAHVLFELGITLLIRPLRLPDARPKGKDMEEVDRKGIHYYFIHRAREIAINDIYVRYLQKGWTPKLSNEVRHILAPTMVKTVSVIWYSAAKDAGLCE